MKKYLSTLLAVCMMLTATCLPAMAYEYTFDGADGGTFGEPTSDHTIYVFVSDDTNIDRSKTAAVIPPYFGSPTSYTLNAGEYLTPNLIEQNQQYDAAANTSTGVTVMPPSMLPATEDPFTVTNASGRKAVSRHALYPRHRPDRQGLSRDGQRNARQRRGTLCRNVRMGRQHCGCRTQPRRQQPLRQDPHAERGRHHYL